MVSKAFCPDGKTWGSNIIHITDRDLPGLKFLFLSESLSSKHELVLEVGCSGGRHLRSLLAIRRDIICFGCDIDRFSVHYGHKISPEINFIVGDGLNLPYKEGVFDAVAIMDYLEHVSDANRAIEEVKRVVKSGGVITAFVPCEGNKLSFYYLFNRLFGFNVKATAGGHTQLFSSNGLLDLITKKGLKVERIRYSYHFLGALFDFAFFLMVHLSKKLANLWWSSNKYYQDPSKAWSSVSSRFLNSILEITNLIAYYESRLLHKVKASACGIHFLAVKR